MLYLDIDDFKAYNDRYGHPEGDYVLRRIAQSIIAALRDEDIAARYGGEEFAVIVALRGPRRPPGRGAGARLGGAPCSPLDDQRISGSITVSVGIATLGAKSPRPQELVKVADGRMYDAKRRGKNLVASGDPSASPRAAES